MSSRIKRRVRIGGGQYVTKMVHLPKAKTLDIRKEIPATPQVDAPIAEVSKTKAPKDIAKITKGKEALPKPIEPSIVICKPETKAKRNEILKAINDALTGKEMKPIKQKGGFLRQLI